MNYGRIYQKDCADNFVFWFRLFLKKVKLFDAKDASSFLKLVFYVCMPALTLTSLIETELTHELLFLPFLPIITMSLTWVIAKIVLKFKPQNIKTTATYLSGCMIMNTGFTLPFFLAGYGNDGFTKAILFDIGNSFLIYTWVYYITIKAGFYQQFNRKAMILKLVFMPPLWALLIALFLKNRHTEIPTPLNNFFLLAGKPTIPLIMLSLGLYFEPIINNVKKALSVLFVRMICGFAIGLAIVHFLPFDPITKIVIIASSGAPVGYNTLVFSTMEELDKDFAATVVSLSILTGIFWVPLLFFIFS